MKRITEEVADWVGKHAVGILAATLVAALAVGPLLVVHSANATDFTIQTASSTTSTSYPVQSYTNSTNTWTACEACREHTFAAVNGIATNQTTNIYGASNTLTLSATLDLTNYFPVWTNVSTTNLGAVGTVYTGHVLGFKAVVSESNATNCNVGLQYEAGN